MMSRFLVTLLTIVATSYAINRPVYKIVLTQKGYTQFLQYDVETPPLREFTFCTWIRIYDLDGDQSIFTYVVNGNNRLLRLWLDSGGRFLKFSINDRITSATPLEEAKDVWRHVCLSYQSDFGAWALYIDSKLLTCQSTQSLYGFVLPGGGSVIIGYGTANNGIPNGFEGEIFGVNMLLVSTIEKNRTISENYLYQQKSFHKNKVKDSEKNIQYVILNDLQTDEIHNNFEKISTPSFLERNNSFIRLKTQHSSIDHDVGLNHKSAKSNIFKSKDISSEKEITDFSVTDSIRTTSKNNNVNFWNFINTAGREGKFKVNKKDKSSHEQSESGTKDIVMLSEFETPPPPPPNLLHDDFSMKRKELETSPKSLHIIGRNLEKNPLFTKNIAELPNYLETPPPVKKDTKVYGQWTSSKFAGSVLNYLKSINFHNFDKKTPATIPLIKTSDNFPYASDFKISKLRPPVQFQRRNFIDHKIRLHKRGIHHSPQINVEILGDELRNDILKMHAETRPRNVKITNRGATKKTMDQRYYRYADNDAFSEENFENFSNIYKPKPFSSTINTNKKNKHMPDLESHKSNSLMTILPFLKSLEYFIEDSKNTGSERVVHSSDMYTKSLSNANKWHNVKSYSNDYTPRRINMGTEDGNTDTDLDNKIAEANNKHPSVRLKYKHESSKLISSNDDPSIVKGRELAIGISNQSNTNQESISIIKYNHGYLPAYEKKNKNTKKGKPRTKTTTSTKLKRMNGKTNFHKQVKLGNALNERHVIGYNEEQKKKSFIGGYENVPDINRYRSDIDNEDTNVPSSLGPRVCKNTPIDSRTLYIQQDGSIIGSHIESPVRKKNIAIEFIQQNYNKCSLEGSNFESSKWLFIDWSNTPVRLFGGAYPKTTTDLCGFF